MDYIKIKKQHDLDVFLKQTHYLEDAIIKELIILNDAYVDSEYFLHGHTNCTFNVKILIQTQWEDVPAVELLCLGVNKIAIDSEYDLGMYGRVESDKIDLFFDESQNNTNGMVMKFLQYRLLDNEYLGQRGNKMEN